MVLCLARNAINLLLLLAASGSDINRDRRCYVSAEAALSLPSLLDVCFLSSFQGGTLRISFPSLSHCILLCLLGSSAIEHSIQSVAASKYIRHGTSELSITNQTSRHCL